MADEGEVSALVCDNGSGMVKAGFAGDDQADWWKFRGDDQADRWKFRACTHLNTLLLLLLGYLAFHRPQFILGLGHRTRAKTVRFAIVTACSSNHAAENLDMLRSLADSRYGGIVSVYYMHKVDALDMAHAEFRLLQKYKLQLKKVKAQIKLQTLVIEEQERLDTYCFKPRVVQMFLRVFDDLDAFMWADSSTRFLGNPETWVSHVLEDGVGFAGRLGRLGMGENTHPATYAYLNVDRTKFKNFTEIAATYWIANLQSDVYKTVLAPWIACGVHNCLSCMAPPGSSRKLTKPGKGPPSTEYIVHRYDQSVLSILLYEWDWQSAGNIQIGNPKYIDVQKVSGSKTPLR
jgi:hypothetical protein